jgi:hypothetical protein
MSAVPQMMARKARFMKFPSIAEKANPACIVFADVRHLDCLAQVLVSPM